MPQNSPPKEYPSNARSKNLALAALLAGAIGIGFAPILSKLAISVDGVAGLGDASKIRLAPVAVAFWRMALATPYFWIAAWRAHRRATSGDLTRATVEPSAIKFSPMLLLPGLFFAIDLGAWHWSFEFTSVANATLEANFAAVLVPLVSFFFFGEKFSPLFVVGALVALLGMGRLVGFSLAATGDAWIGDLIGIGVAGAYSAYLLASKRLLLRFSVPRVMAYATTASAVFLAVGALLTPGRFFPVTVTSWIYLGALALIAQVFGQGMIALGMSRLSAGFSAVTLVLQPVVVAFLGWLALDQPMSSGQMATALVVLAGIVLAKFGTR